MLIGQVAWLFLFQTVSFKMATSKMALKFVAFETHLTHSFAPMAYSTVLTSQTCKTKKAP